ncbi:MAG: mucoidy inhibitor MuiA family protein [Alphaproteobacteria bacterium]
MHRFLLLSALFVVQPAWAKDITVEEHKISDVVVYNDRATLTRVAKVEIPAGAHNLVLKGIPVTIYADSLRSKGNATAKVIFGALSHKRVSSAEYVVPKEQELHKKLIALQDTRKIYNADKQALAISKRFLESIGQQASLRENEEIAKLELNPEEWAKAADGLASKVSEITRKSLALDIKVRETDEAIRKVQNDLNTLRTGQKQTYDVTIPYEVDTDTTLTVELSYQIPQVGWHPIYDARLNTQNGKMELIQYGSVWQRTGEDWDDVRLTLSTARPNRGTGLPDLHPHWVSILQKHVARKSMRGGNNFGNIAANITGGAQMMEMDAVALSAAPQELEMVREEAIVQSAQINTNGFVSEYKIKGLANVKSDGTHSKLLVGSFETENKFQVQIKPQISSEAYLVVKAKLKGEAPILAGQVNLFRDEAFIGRSHLPMLRPDDVEELSFGVDDNVTVRRNTLKNKQSEAGLIAKENVLEKRFVTEIKNLHKRPVSIAVLETIPVSQDQRIRIELLKGKTTKGYEADLHDMKGVYRWRQELKAGQASKVTLGWSVTWPKGENISGL